MLGESDVMLSVFDQVREVSSVDSNVLLLGETGTGQRASRQGHSREQPAQQRGIGQGELRAPSPAKSWNRNCSGTKKAPLPARCKSASVNLNLPIRAPFFWMRSVKCPLTLQTKLLRVLQEKEVERLGSNELIKLDFRLISATNRNLEEEVSKGNFRADLYYRLNTYPIYVPPLQARGDDVLLLADSFARQLSEK